MTCATPNTLFSVADVPTPSWLTQAVFPAIVFDHPVGRCSCRRLHWLATKRDVSLLSSAMPFGFLNCTAPAGCGPSVSPMFCRPKIKDTMRVAMTDLLTIWLPESVK